MTGSSAEAPSRRVSSDVGGFERSSDESIYFQDHWVGHHQFPPRASGQGWIELDPEKLRHVLL